MLIVLIVILSGCSQEQETSVRTETTGNVISRTQQQALDKARSVEQTLIDADQRRRQSVDGDQTQR